MAVLFGGFTVCQASRTGLRIVQFIRLNKGLFEEIKWGIHYVKTKPRLSLTQEKACGAATEPN